MGFWKTKENNVRAVWKLLCVLLSFFLFAFGSIILFNTVISFAYAFFNALSGADVDPQSIAEMVINNHLLNTFGFILQNFSMIFAVILFWKLFEKKPVKDLGLTSLKIHGKDLVYGLLFGAGSMALVFFVLLFTKQINVVNDFSKPNFSWVLLIDLFLMIMVGISEELFSRGYCMSILKKSHILIMFLVPNIIFALLHSFNSNIGILPLINLFLVGLLFSVMFYLRGNIWMPIGYHITWNYFQGSVFGLPVSGMDSNGLYTSNLVSDNIFNGGAFGPEGGLLVTILILASIALVFFLNKKKTPIDYTTIEIK